MSRRSVLAGSGLTMALICSAQFILQLDFSIVNVALPTIQTDLSMPAAELQWIVTGYALTFGSLLLAGGRLADLLGRRRLLVTGLILFGVASLACGLAQWPVMLIVSRMVQGAAGAMVSPAALSLLTTTNPEGQARNRALAIWQATTAAGATAGIIAGGVLTEYLGWRAVFLVNPPLIVIMLSLSGRLPAAAPSGGNRLDYRGAILVTAALASLIFGLSDGQQQGFGAPVTIAALVVALVLGIAFGLVESKEQAPMLPLSIFASGSRRAAVVAMVMIGAVLAGYVYFVSLFLQKVLHFSPLLTGLALVPSTVTVVAMSTLGTRRLLARMAAWKVLLTGLGCLAAGQLWLAQVSDHATYPAVVLPGLILTSIGIGLALPTASIAITSGVARQDQGLAGALFTTSQQTGAAVGLAVLATAAAARTAHAGGSLVAGYQLSFLIAAGIILLAAIAFFTELGMELEGRSPIEESWAGNVVGLDGMRSEIAMMRIPDAPGRLELAKYHAPKPITPEPEIPPANTLGLHRVMFAVDDMEDTLARLRKHGAELVGEVARFEDSYLLCYLRGPSGIILALAEQLS